MALLVRCGACRKRCVGRVRGCRGQWPGLTGRYPGPPGRLPERQGFLLWPGPWPGELPVPSRNRTSAGRWPLSFLGTASAELKARFVIGGGGQGVKVRWRGTVDKYKPNVTAHGWQHGLRGRAANLMKDFIKQRSRPLRISGSFSSLSAR